jgi:hypothetical protein
MTTKEAVVAAGLEAAKAIVRSPSERTPSEWLEYCVKQKTKPWEPTKPFVQKILGYIEHATDRPLDEIENARAAAQALKNASLALGE